MISENNQVEQLVARITVQARLEFLPAVMSFMRDAAIKLGLGQKEAERLELVVEEACLNVIENAFDPGETGTYDVSIISSLGQLKISIEDSGLPFDVRKYEEGQDSSLGVILMRAFADEVHFVNLGRAGKRVDIIKKVPYSQSSAFTPGDAKVLSPTVAALPSNIPIAVRKTQPEDAVNLARCIYRCYGYSYPVDYFYYPDMLKELLEKQLLLSYIAINPEGEVIGHIAIKRDSLAARIGEVGNVVIDPRYRGSGFLGQLALGFAEYALQSDLCGVFSEAVTVHPFSQKTAIAMGGFETGVLLAFLPADINFKKIENVQVRQSAMIFYISGDREPARNIYPPLHHEGIIREIYGRSRLKRNISSMSANRDKIELPEHATLNVRVIPVLGQAYLKVTGFGTDLEEQVKFRLHELCLKRIDCIYIDLPLCNPATPHIIPVLEMMGFFFGCIVPELDDGDIFRLQYLNNVDVEQAKVHTATEFGMKLTKYILQAQKGN